MIIGSEKSNEINITANQEARNQPRHGIYRMPKPQPGLEQLHHQEANHQKKHLRLDGQHGREGTGDLLFADVADSEYHTPSWGKLQVSSIGEFNHLEPPWSTCHGASQYSLNNLTLKKELFHNYSFNSVNTKQFIILIIRQTDAVAVTAKISGYHHERHSTSLFY